MKHPVLALVIAFVLALGAGAAVYWYAAGAQSRALAAQSPVTVLTTLDVIPLGMSLAAADSGGLVGRVEVPEDLAPVGAISDIDPENGALLALADIPNGQILMSGQFAAALPQSMPIEIPPGMMAVTVQFEDPAKVGSFLRPGTHVAVMDTYIEPGAAADAEPVKATRPLLGDVLVLAVGTTPESGETTASADAWTAPLVTLAVDQGQAERLVHAARTGQLYLALLGDDAVIKASSGVSDTNLFTK